MKFNLNLDSINYIKIVYSDRNGSPHCVKAAIKRMGEKEIFACAKFEGRLNIKTPQDVILSFICENGLYRTGTVLKFIQYEEPYIFFTLKTPDGIEYQQTREYFRVRLEENVILSYSKHNEVMRIACKSYDLSANGIKLQFDTPIQIPKDVQISINFEKRNVKTRARLIRIDEDDKVFKASFKFINLQEQDMDYISQICIQKQLEYKRARLQSE